MTHPQLSEILQKLRCYLHELYGDRLISLILFGSQARGDADPDSDIDMLVVLEGQVAPWAENERTAEFVSKLCLDYSVVICNIFISSEEFISKQSALLQNIAREGVNV